jgi:hypothetical protein
MNKKALFIWLTTALFFMPAWSIPAICGEIHDAAEAGDLAKVAALLKENPELVFRKDSDSRTPLLCAIAPERQDVKEMLRWLIPDAAAIKPATPLYKDVVELGISCPGCGKSIS